MQTNGLPVIGVVFLYIAIAAIIVFRYSRKQRISTGRLWFAPLFLAAMGCLSIYETQQMVPVSPLVLALSLAIGAALGVPFGYLRGEHTSVTLTDTPGVMMLGPSWVVPAIWVGAFALRAIIRSVAGFSALGMAIGDGSLAFATSALVISSIAIYRKYQCELGEASDVAA